MNDYRVEVVSYRDRPNYVLRWTDPITGKKKSKSSTIANDGKQRSRSQASKEAGRLAIDLQNENLTRTERISWSAFVETFEDRHLSQLSPRSFQTYATALRQFEIAISPSHLDVIRIAEIERFRSGLQRRGLSHSTIRNYLRHLKAALGWAKAQGLIKSPPLINMSFGTRQKSDSARGRGLSDVEFQQLLDAITHVVNPSNESLKDSIVESWSFLLQGLVLSGLRISEACNLYWDDDAKIQVVFDRRNRAAIHFPRTLQKNGREETVPATPAFHEFLNRVQPEQRVGKVFQVIGDRGTKLLMDPLMIGKKISAFGRQAGIVVSEKNGKVKFASAHDLRRTFGCRQALAVMPSVLMKLMRHSEISTTMKYYAQLDSEVVADALWQSRIEGNKSGNKDAKRLGDRQPPFQLNHDANGS